MLKLILKLLMLLLPVLGTTVSNLLTDLTVLIIDHNYNVGLGESRA